MHSKPASTSWPVTPGPVLWCQEPGHEVEAFERCGTLGNGLVPAPRAGSKQFRIRPIGLEFLEPFTRCRLVGAVYTGIRSRESSSQCWLGTRRKCYGSDGSPMCTRGPAPRRWSRLGQAPEHVAGPMYTSTPRFLIWSGPQVAVLAPRRCRHGPSFHAFHQSNEDQDDHRGTGDECRSTHFPSRIDAGTRKL